MTIHDQVTVLLNCNSFSTWYLQRDSLMIYLTYSLHMCNTLMLYHNSISSNLPMLVCSWNLQHWCLCWWSTLEGHHPCFPIVCIFRFDTQIWSTSRWVLHTALNSGWTDISINRCIMHLCFCSIISSTMSPLYIIHFTINQNLLALMSSLYWVLPNMYYEIGVCWCHMENI